MHYVFSNSKWVGTLEIHVGQVEMPQLNQEFHSHYLNIILQPDRQMFSRVSFYINTKLTESRAFLIGDLHIIREFCCSLVDIIQEML